MRCAGLWRHAAARASEYSECAGTLRHFNECVRFDYDVEWFECGRRKRFERGEWFIAIDDCDCQFIYPVGAVIWTAFWGAIAAESQLGAESLLRQRDDGYGDAGDAAAFAR